MADRMGRRLHRDRSEAGGGAVIPFGHERALLGCALLDPTILDQFGHRLSPHDWLRPQHAALWVRMRELRDDARHARAQDGWPAVVLGEAFTWGAEVDGAGYVAGICADAPSVEAAPYYLDRVVKASLKRHALDLLARTAERINAGEEPDVALAAFDAAAGELTHRDSLNRPEWVRLGLTAGEVYERTQEMQRDPEASSRLVVRTPWRGLDQRIGGGFRPGQVTILAGRPATGKTAAAMQIASHIARSGRGVGVFSMEMARADLTMREFARLGTIRLDGLLHADLSAGEWRQMTVALEAMDTTPLWIDDSPSPHILELRRRARKLASIAEKAGAPLSLLVVDYLQLATARASKVESREQEVAAVSRALLALAKELRVPIVALAQMNLGVEGRVDIKPRMSDLRESGQIEQDAQNIIFTFHDDDDPDDDTRSLVVAKARSGQPGEVAMTWHGAHQRLDEVSALRPDERPALSEVSRADWE
jgi:replicative DNA helicase